MDKKLQKFILGIIKNGDGEAKKNHIFNKTSRGYFKETEQSPKTNTITQHQLDLLEKEDKLVRKDQLPDTPYILTQTGHREFDSWWEKSWRFVLYDKHNVFVVLSLLISFGALAVSIIFRYGGGCAFE